MISHEYQTPPQLSHRTCIVSRVINLAMSADEVRHQCQTRQVGVSALETLPDGGVRLVCMSSDGAATIRKRLKANLINGDVRRTANGRERSPIEGWQGD
jgi:hypothetical protein